MTKEPLSSASREPGVRPPPDGWSPPRAAEAVHAGTADEQDAAGAGTADEQDAAGAGTADEQDAAAARAAEGPERGSVCPGCGETPAVAGQTLCRECGTLLGPDPLVGTVIEDRYEVVKRLGAGAMGAVYEVRHLRLNKRFAMKIIRQALSQEPEFAARFEQEALSTSRLEHPNCIAVTDFGQTGDGLLYLVMDFLEGRSLSSILGRPLPVGRAITIARQILLGLQHAHQAGVIHRDVKPENVMVLGFNDSFDRIKVLDFGIAKLPLAARAGSGGDSTRLTEAGVVFGTPDYMAPEQALGSADVDERADLYAVGVILWNMLTGRPLFVVDNSIEMLQTKLASDPPPLGRICPGVFSRELEQTVARALARNPRQRFGAAGEFIAAIDTLLASPGRGLATNGAGGRARLGAVTDRVSEVVATATRTISGAFRHWYAGTLPDLPPARGEQDGPGAAIGPTWNVRLRSLPATRPGRIVLGTATAAVLCLGLLSAFVWWIATRSADDRAPPGGLHPRSGAGDSSADQGGPAAVPAVNVDLDARTRRRLDAAYLLLGRHACSEAVLDLRALVHEQPKLARAWYLLGAAGICRGEHASGLQAYERAIALDRRYRHDARILEDVGGLLVARDRKLRPDAIDFLEQRIGKPALKLLGGAATSTDRRVRHRAIAALVRLEAAEKIDWVTSLHLDLRQLPCREARRRKIVDRMAAVDDPRVLPILREARRARTGLLGHRQRYACLRKEINRAIKRLEKQHRTRSGERRSKTSN